MVVHNVENTVVFIKGEDDIDKKTSEIVTKIYANSPKMFIISSMGSTMDKCEKIKNGVEIKVSNYAIELYQTINRKIYFLNKKEEM